MIQLQIEKTDLMEDFSPEIVVHTAASYKDPNNWYGDASTNCVGGANLVDLSKKYMLKDSFFSNGTLLWIKTINSRFNWIIREIHQRAVMQYQKPLVIGLSGLDYVTLRLANVIGPRNVAGPLPIFFRD